MERDIQAIVRYSEVMAVARAIRSGRTPIVGEELDYYVEFPPSERHLNGFAVPRKPTDKPYRFAVEQWHLDEAELQK